MLARARVLLSASSLIYDISIFSVHIDELGGQAALHTAVERGQFSSFGLIVKQLREIPPRLSVHTSRSWNGASTRAL